MQTQDMSLVLSTDAKPRLKWTPELHQRFVEAITQLGGADKATPKTLMRMIGIPGLTLYHLKSHLQKYRLGKNLQSEDCSDNKEDCQNNQISDVRFGSNQNSDGTKTEGSLHIAQALHIQMEVQRKLHEQIEVQRHLQLRIEAQGKYLQSVLEKAQETLAGYCSSSVGMELAKAELSQLVSMVNTGCPSSSISELTETRSSNTKETEKKPMRGTGTSIESSLTSSESSGRKEERQQNNCNIILLEAMETHPKDGQPWTSGLSDQANGLKRSGSTISDGNCVPAKRLQIHKEKNGNQLRKLGLPEMLDLNSQYQIDINSGPNSIDLNYKQ